MACCRFNAFVLASICRTRDCPAATIGQFLVGGLFSHCLDVIGIHGVAGTFIVLGGVLVIGAMRSGSVGALGKGCARAGNKRQGKAVVYKTF